jgi:hypothetical protein
MKSSSEVVAGVPQIIYKVPLDGSVSPLIADLDFAQIFDRLIVGPTPYPWPIYGAFVEALKSAGVPTLKSACLFRIFRSAPRSSNGQSLKAISEDSGSDLRRVRQSLPPGMQSAVWKVSESASA